MHPNFDASPLPKQLRAILHDIQQAKGRGVIVGGWVRDQLLGIESKDIDVEVYGLKVSELHALLKRHGPVAEVGKSFGVLLFKPLDIDFSLPRKDTRVGDGHKGFDITVDPHLDFKEAARRRDITINSIGYDPIAKTILDPFDGRQDLEKGVLKATDPKHFSEDPLRALRVMQFAARFEMQPDAELIRLCSTQDLATLSAERIREEFLKLLLKAKKPSVGLQFLRQANLLRFFSELESLIDTPQDPTHHPEGDVWVHTLMVIDVAAQIRDRVGERTEADTQALMFAALCHDFGKPISTHVEPDGRVRSPGHETSGLEPTERFLNALKSTKQLVQKVRTLVRYHLAPHQLTKQNASDKAYRRLVRKLQSGSVHPSLLAELAEADHYGRTTSDARAGLNPKGEQFLQRLHTLNLFEPLTDAVQGRHLIARGLAPGPEFKAILEKCRQEQDSSGLADPNIILDRVLAAHFPEHDMPRPKTPD